MNPIQLSTGSSNVLLVSLPEYAEKISLSLLGHNLLWFAGERYYGYKHSHRSEIVLPPGNWIEVGWSDSLSEAQAKELFNCDNGIAYPMFGGIEEGKKKMRNYCKTAKEALQSFLSANNIKEKKFVLRDNK